MSHEIERRFKEKQSNYSERIRWDTKTKEYYIERSFPHTKEIERHEVSEWNMVRRVETFILIARQIESVELEEPTKMVFYKLPLTYEIRSGQEFEDWFLVPNVVSNEDDPHQKKFLTIVMKNANNGQAMSVPMDNDTYHGEYKFLKITKGKSIRISKTELEEAVLSGQCMGVYSMDLRNRIVS